MKRHGLIALLVLVLAGAAWGQEKPAEKGVGVMLPKQGFAFAVLPKSGAMAVLHAGKEGVTIYPNIAKGSVEEATTIKIAGTPNDLLYKQVGDKGYLLVLCSGDGTLHVLDETKLEEVAKIKMTITSPGFFVAPQSAANPYVYYYSTGRMSMDSLGIGRANLSTLADDGLVTVANTGRGLDIDAFTMSANGLRMYGWRRHVSPSGVFLLEVDEAKKTISQVSYRHDGLSPFFPDPFNNYVAVNSQLFKYNLNDSEKINGNVLLFHPEKPVMFSYLNGEFEAFSYNNFKTLGKLTLPVVSKQQPFSDIEPGGREMLPTRIQLFYDAKDNGVIVCSMPAVAFVPLAALEIPDVPLLYAEVSGPTSANVGQPMTLELKPKDARAKIALKSGPKDAIFAANKLTWTPAAADVGQTLIVLKISGGGVEREQTVELTVRRSAINLDFVPSDIKLSSDGKTLALLDLGLRTGRVVRENPPKPFSRIVLLDTAKGTVLADRSFTTNARTFALDANFVYLALTDSDAFYALARKDLSDSKRIFTKGRVSAFLPVNDKRLYVQTEGQGPMTAYETPALTPLEQPADENAALRFYDPYGRSSFPQAVGAGYYFRGILYDADMAKVRMMLAPEGFAYALPANNALNRFNPNQQQLGPSTWGLYVEGSNQLKRPTGQKIGQVDAAMAGVLLSDYPALVTLASPAVNAPANNDARRTRFQLCVNDLVTAAAQPPMLLADELQQNTDMAYDPYGQRTGTRLAAAPGLVVAQIYARLFVIPTKDLGLEILSEPLHFTLEQKTLVLDKAKPTSFAVEARGGKSPLEYNFTQEFDGFTIDKTKGIVTIDPAKILPKALDTLTQQLSQSIRNVPATPGTTQPDAATGLEKYQQQVAAKFSKLIGRAPEGIPVLVPIRVTTNDAEMQTAAYEAVAFLEVGTDELAARLKKAEDEAKAQREKQLAAQREYENRANTPQPDAEIAALQAKLLELEKRNAALEAQVQLLKELVGNRGAATEPYHPK